MSKAWKTAMNCQFGVMSTMPKNEKNLTKIFLTKWIQMEQEEQDESYTFT